MTKLKRIYKQIWDSRPHRCEVCGYPLKEPIAHVFSHIYSKGSYPSLKYEPKNIELWCSTLLRSDGQRGCHDLWSTNPVAFWERADRHGWTRPPVIEIKRETETVN